MDGDSALIECKQNRFGFDPIDGETRDVRKSSLGVRCEEHCVSPRTQPVLERGLQRAKALAEPGATLCEACLGGGTESRDADKVLEPSTPGSLLSGSDEERRNANPATHDERSHARRSADC